MNERLQQAIDKIAITESATSSIGTKQEKTLHKTIKYYLSLNEAEHEQRVERNIIDVYTNGLIYEIQTAGFDKMRHKLEVLLPKYDVTIVYPIPYIKTIYLVSEQGELVSSRKSPRKGSPYVVFPELYKIKSYLKDPHFHLKIIMLNTNEYRDQVPKRHFLSKGYKRNDQIVTDIVKEINFETTSDYLQFIDELTSDFITSQDIKKHYKTTKKESALATNILCYLGILEKVGAKNHFYLYKKKLTV